MGDPVWRRSCTAAARAIRCTSSRCCSSCTNWTVRDAELALPTALRESIRERLRRLPEPARALLDIAAVLGRRFDVFALERGAGMTGSALADAVDLLVQRRLLREFDEGASLDFGHHRIREVVYEGLGAARRIVLHRRAAEALVDSPGDNTAAIAAHCEAAGEWAGAITQLRAGRAAFARAVGAARGGARGRACAGARSEAWRCGRCRTAACGCTSSPAISMRRTDAAARQ